MGGVCRGYLRHLLGDTLGSHVGSDHGLGKLPQPLHSRLGEKALGRSGCARPVGRPEDPPPN